ncbi:MAG: hypothetical protein ABI744_07620 [Chloroflexota bacterium]
MPGLVHRLALVALAAIKAATAAFAMDGVVHSETSRFKGKGMRLRAIGYFAGLALVPVVWLFHGRTRPYPAGADLALSVPLFVDAAGNALGIYDADRLDDLVHLGNSAALSGLFGAVISPHIRTRVQATGIVVIAGMAGGVAWEVMEYVGQALGLRALQLTDKDTEADLATDLIGTAIGALVTWIRWQPTGDRPLVGWAAISPAPPSQPIPPAP